MERGMLGIYVASVTPFSEDGSVAGDVLAQLMERNLGEGADGFFIGGSSAECFLLSHKERVETFEVASRFKGRAKLIAHVGSLSTWEAVAFAKEAKALGFERIAATPPLYYGYTSREVKEYYYEISRAVGMPLIVYHFPGNTKREIDLWDPHYRELFTSGAVSGVKHTNQVVYQMERFMELNPSLDIFNGYDETMVAGLALGARGSIGSTFNCMLPHYRRIFDSFVSGDVEGARELQRRANNIMEAFCRVGLIPAVKYVLGRQGVAAGTARRPFGQLSAEDRAYVDQVWDANIDEGCAGR